MKYRAKEIAHIMGAKVAVNIDSCICTLLTDSRRLSSPADSLFFALPTKSNDGHRYIETLYEAGVRNFVVSHWNEDFENRRDVNYFLVDNTLEALRRLVIYHRQRFSIPVIGITGSNGKTIVKEFLYQLLREDFNIVRSPRSYNSQLGVPLSVAQMQEEHTLGIFEAGISQMDEMDRLREVICPTVGVLTNIGQSHQENFVSTRQKCIEKLQLFRDCEVLIFNGDDPFICDCVESACLSHKALMWSKKNSEAPLFVESIEQVNEKTKIQCVVMGMSHTYWIPFMDNASVENVLQCLAVMLFIKPSSLSQVERFEKLELVEMRLEVKQGRHNCELINDSYNLDSDSLEIALDFQRSRMTDKYGKSTLILSDIRETGLVPKALYKRVAKWIDSRQVDRLIGIGRDLTAFADYFDMEKSFYLTTEDFLASKEVDSFDKELILIKGARRFHFERIAEQLEKKAHETILEVNLTAIADNFNYFRSKLKPETKMVCMVKALGYGVGAVELAKTLQQHRCDYLAVAVADEGAQLCDEGITMPILVMNPEISALTVLFDNFLEPEVYSFRLLDALIKETDRRGITSYPIHIKIDTGMHRLGFQPQEMLAVCERLKNHSGLRIRSVFSHLVGADDSVFDDFTRKQIHTFKEASAVLEEQLGYPVIKHILNSAGIERFTDDQMDMVRLGIGLYGISPSGFKGLRRVSTLKTTILQIQQVKKDESIGYSRRSFMKRDGQVAIVPIGYADGVSRKLGNGVGEMSIGGKRCPIIGNVCMDTCMLDVTDIDAKAGDTVIVFGDDLPIEEISDKLGTIPYEEMTAVSSRVKRVYFRE